MDLLQPTCLSAAFWLALAGFRAGGVRFVAGLGLGAALAHLGWAVLYLHRLSDPAAALLDPARGYCVLLVPLGPLLTAPWRQGPRWRDRYLAGCLRALTPALAVARLGCLLAGCCHGVASEVPWALPLAGVGRRVEPTPLYEMVGLLALWGLLRKLPERWVPPAFLIAFGLLRLLTEPLRAAPPLGAPAVSVEALAAAWVAAGGIWWRRSRYIS